MILYYVLCVLYRRFYCISTKLRRARCTLYNPWHSDLHDRDDETSVDHKLTEIGRSLVAGRDKIRQGVREEVVERVCHTCSCRARQGVCWCVWIEWWRNLLPEKPVSLPAMVQNNSNIHCICTPFIISHLPYNAKADIGSLDHAHIITTIACKTMFSLISYNDLYTKGII